MADTKGTPGGLPHKLNAMYRDLGDGTFAEVFVSDMWVYDSVLLDYRKLTVADLLGSASDETSTIYSGTTALTPKFAKISTSSSGASEVIALVAAKKIRVLSYVVVANAAVNVKFQSHTFGDKTGLMYCAANGGVSTSYNPVGHFETVAGEALDINLSGNVAVGGHVTYIEVT